MRTQAGRRSSILSCALVAALACPGCAGFGDYMIARCDDISDCARLRAGFALGLYAEAEVTSFVKPAVGFADMGLDPQYVQGWDPRPDRRAGQFRTAAFPGLILGWPYYGAHETASGYGDTHPYWRGAVAPFILMGNDHIQNRSHGLFALDELIPNPRLLGPDGKPPPALPLVEHGWCAASATLLFITVDTGVNLLQIGDFLAGIVGFDPADDDRPPRFRPPVPKEPGAEADPPPPAQYDKEPPH